MTPEHEVIGQILQKPSLLAECDLTPAEFISEQNQEIFSVIMDLSNAGISIDVFSVSDELRRKTSRDWLQVVGEIQNKIGYLHFPAQVNHVRNNGRLVAAKRILAATNFGLDNKDISVVDECIKQLMELNAAKNKYLHNVDDCITGAMDHIEKAMSTKGSLGLDTGLTELNTALGGFHDTDLIVVGARPAMGKTAFMMNCAVAGARSGPVLVISAEQGFQQIGLRLLSIVGSVDSQKVRAADLDEGEWSDLSKSVITTRKLPIYVYDEPSPTISGVIRVARALKYQRNIRAIYVDYIQRIDSASRGQRRMDAVGEVTRALKSLARELEIPVIALAQVKREVESRNGDARPSMGDLADSSEIEKEADAIMTLYRDEVYKPDTDQKGVAEIILCKNRHGPTGKIRALWRGRYMQFKDISHNSGAGDFYG